MEKSSSSSSSRSLEVTIISAENLRKNHRSIKKNAFVTLETDPNNSQSTSMADSIGGSYPSWNEKFELTLPYNLRYIRLEVKCKTATGVKTIGSVNIPISDLLEDFIPPSCLHHLSYRLRERDGDRNGIINLSIRMKGADSYVPRPSPYMRVQTGYKINSNACRSMPMLPTGIRQTAYNNTGGIAMGIPVSKGYGLVL
ncbi:Bon1-associated protein [Thalictrum thalictroides]|uniref:Bon1-associated protein n=1 Tax=Thalictrum thalictroides TaxID=46969 RepID=A0A7J6WCR6_THATH|nr:Bon1-associated protein [Thalictrum thalictroides]